MTSIPEKEMIQSEDAESDPEMISVTTEEFIGILNGYLKEAGILGFVWMDNGDIMVNIDRKDAAKFEEMMMLVAKMKAYPVM